MDIRKKKSENCKDIVKKVDTILQQLQEFDVDRNKVIGCGADSSFQYQQISFCHGKIEGHIYFTPITTRTASTTTRYQTEKHYCSIRRAFGYNYTLK
jgi:hypothetical protein